MASIRRHGKGWRAEVFRQGKRRSKVLATKAAAMAWAVDTERELAQDVPTKPVRALLQRYLEDVTSHKRSRQAEEHRVKRLQADELAAVMLADLGPRHITDWRDRALKARSAAAGPADPAECVLRTDGRRPCRSVGLIGAICYLWVNDRENRHD